MRPDAPETHEIRPGGVPAEALLFRAGAPDAPCVVVFPALGTPARPYRRLAARLQRLGVHVLVADWRGLASSQVRAARGRDWGYLDLVDGEAAAMLSLARSELPDAQLHALGHSLGGQVALLHAARHPNARVDSVLLVASASPYYRGYPHPYRWLVRTFGWVAGSTSRWLGVFRGDWFRFGGKQGARLMREWAQFVASGSLPPLGDEGWSSDPALAQLALPVLVVSMAGDRLAPRSAAERLVAKTAASARYAHVELLAGGGQPGHFDWLREPDPVAGQIVGWLRDAQSASKPETTGV